MVTGQTDGNGSDGNGQIVGWMIGNCSPVGVYMPQLVHSTHLDVPTKHYSLDVKLKTTIIDDP